MLSEMVTCNCVRNPGGHAESNHRPSEEGVSFYLVLRPLDLCSGLILQLASKDDLFRACGGLSCPLHCNSMDSVVSSMSYISLHTFSDGSRWLPYGCYLQGSVHRNALSAKESRCSVSHMRQTLLAPCKLITSVWAGKSVQ